MFPTIMYVLHLEKHKMQNIKNQNINTEKQAYDQNSERNPLDKAKNEEIIPTNLIRIPKEVNRKGRYQKPIRTRIFRTTFFNFESYAFS